MRGEEQVTRDHRSFPKTKMERTCQLPTEKVFPIQIGSELFRLSGASLASDGNRPGPGVSVRADRQLPPTSRASSRTNYFKPKMHLISEPCTSIGTPLPFARSPDIYRVILISVIADAKTDAVQATMSAPKTARNS